MKSMSSRDTLHNELNKLLFNLHFYIYKVAYIYIVGVGNFFGIHLYSQPTKHSYVDLRAKLQRF